VLALFVGKSYLESLDPRVIEPQEVLTLWGSHLLDDTDGYIFFEMDTEEIPRCSSCGMCCRGEQRYGLFILPGDYERWVQERRKDILCYVEQSVYSLNRAIIWKDVETGEYLDNKSSLSIDLGER